MYKTLTFILLYLFISLNCFGQCDITGSDFKWQTNGVVYSTAKVGNKLYLGGSFSSVSIPCSNVLGFDLADPQRINLRFPSISGTIKAMISDGAGGWIVAGNLTKVGTQTVTHLARIKSDYTLDQSWLPSINGAITAIASENGKLYVAGSFTLVNGSSRQRLACFDLSTFALTSFQFNNSWTINSMAIQNNVLYVAGQFTHSVNPQVWYNLARIDLQTTTLMAPFAYISGAINNCLVQGNTVLISGTFTTVFNQSRSQLALIDTLGTLKPFNPSPNGVVKAMMIKNNTLYLGGSFTSIGGFTRNRLAAFNLATMNILPWNPVMNDEVNYLYESSSKVFAGGPFTLVGASVRNNIAAFDAGTLLLDSFKMPTLNNAITYSTSISNILIATGDFTGCNIAQRVNLAAFNLDDHTLLPWNPDPQNASSTNTITSVKATGAMVIVGGAFSVIAGQNRKHLAMFDTSGNLLSFDAGITGGRVGAIATGSNTIFVGGEFSFAGGAPVSNICAFDASSFHPVLTSLSCNAPVRTLTYHNGLLYAGGQFTTFNNQVRKYVASVDATNGQLSAWSPEADHFVMAIHPAGDKVYLGGYFTQVNSTPRNYLAVVDTLSGGLQAWNPAPDGVVHAVFSLKNKLFVGGAFSNINASPRAYLAMYDEASHTLLTTQIAPDNWISNINAYDSSLFICGGYQNIDGKPSRSFSMYNLFELVPSPNPVVVTASPLNATAMQLNWSRGNGNGYVILARENNAVNANPINNVMYNANALFGAGTAISSDNFVVYKGTDTFAVISGLNHNNTYSFAVFCYNEYGSCVIHSYTPGVVSHVALPVKWISFIGRLNETTVLLEWITASEQNNKGFEVQRSTAATLNESWNTIGFVKGAGNKQTQSRYAHTDNEAAALLAKHSVLYYRLKQLDHNHHAAYSKIISVTAGSEKSFRVYPSPARHSIELEGIMPATYRIMNMAGHQVSCGRPDNKRIVVEALEAGLYLLLITDEAGEIHYAKFVKE